LRGPPPRVRQGVGLGHGALTSVGGFERPPCPPDARHAPGDPGRSSITAGVERARSWWPGPRLVSLLVGGGAAVLVLYPIAYLVQASLSVGDPQARPPEAYGLANYADLGRYAHIFGNTLLVASMATVLAVLVGFAMGWILTRTNVPGRAAFDELMALPYYLT